MTDADSTADATAAERPTAHHVGLTVSDIERAIAFYTDLFDCTVESRFTVDGEAFETVVGVDGAAGSFAHLDAGGTRLELVAYEPAGEPTPSAELVQPGAAHVAFEVADVDAFVNDLPDGVAPLSDPQTTASGTRLVFLRDPAGNRIELLEP